MKVCQIIQSVNNMSAGPTYSVGSLARELSILQCEVNVCSFSSRPQEWPFNVNLNVIDGMLESMGLLGFESIKNIRQIGNEKDIIHCHGVWRAANLFPYFLDRNYVSKIVWSPRGMFSDWSWNQKSYIKQPFWFLLQKNAISYADCIHATAISEYEDIRSRGLKQPVAIIPNGVPIPTLLQPAKKKKEVVFLSRIHKKKGLDLLIDTWSKLQDRFLDWEVKIAGPLDSQYAKEIQKYALDNKLKNFKFIGEVYGEEKVKLLSEASIFILPSYSENFGIAIAESLAHGTPVITTTETPWESVTEIDCGWWVNPSTSEITKALNEALALGEEQLCKKGNKGKLWMAEKYSWCSVASQMHSLYQWLLGENSKPEFVIEE